VRKRLERRNIVLGKELCYLCGQQAYYQFVNGKYCCKENWRSCPEAKRKRTGWVVKREERICPTCGKKFLERLKKKRTFCSAYCSQTATGKNSKNWRGGKWTRKINCKYCGKEIIIKQGKKFCSRGCYSKWQGENLKRENSYNWKGRKEVACGRCGKKFRVTLESKQKYCSMECKYNPREKISCEVCNKEIMVTPTQIHRARFCSKECQYIWMSENIVGANHPNWLGGLSFEPYGIEFNDILKEEIRERDNRQCQYCGLDEEQSIRKLDVHHIDYNKKNNDKSNLISLCCRCHRKASFNRNYWEGFYKRVMSNRRRIKRPDIILARVA